MFVHALFVLLLSVTMESVVHGDAMAVPGCCPKNADLTKYKSHAAFILFAFSLGLVRSSLHCSNALGHA